MDWITDRIAIGNHLDARDVDLLKQHGFRSALSLDGTLSEGDAAKLGLSEVACYPLVDGPGNDLRVLRFAVDDLRRMAESKGPTLVQCHAGRSRSAVVVAAYLMQTCGIDARKAVARVAARRDINITPALVVLLRKLETI
ncbi:MAG: dual specificity protein phosphatase [Isosphaeraceae bacterium]